MNRVKFGTYGYTAGIVFLCGGGGTLFGLVAFIWGSFSALSIFKANMISAIFKANMISKTPL